MSQTQAKELASLGESIAAQAIQLDLVTHHLLVDLRRFDEQRGWTGFPSCAHWLAYRVGWDLATARERVRVARALQTLPKINQALASGKLSYSKARAITRVATPHLQDTLLAHAAHGTASQLENACRKYRIAAGRGITDHVVPDRVAADRAVAGQAVAVHAVDTRRDNFATALPQRLQRRVTLSSTPAGMASIKAVLRADEAALVMEVIQLAAKARQAATPADGLMAIIQSYARSIAHPSTVEPATTPSPLSAEDHAPALSAQTPTAPTAAALHEHPHKPSVETPRSSTPHSSRNRAHRPSAETSRSSTPHSRRNRAHRPSAQTSRSSPPHFLRRRAHKPSAQTSRASTPHSLRSRAHKPSAETSRASARAPKPRGSLPSSAPPNGYGSNP